jgi:prevent-host-death family protein
MRTVKASEFKATCLKLMDLVNATHEEIVITKNGKPVSRLVPYRKPVESLFGLHQGKVLSRDDLLATTGEVWNADA